MDFKERKLVYLEGAGNMKISSSELKEGDKGLDKKKEEGEASELAVDQLAMASDEIIGSYSDQLEELPAEFKSMLHDNIVQYFLTSVDQYDTDAERGLDAVEFAQYSENMLIKLGEILDQYAPSEEQLEARKKQQEAVEEADQAIEEMEDLKLDTVDFVESNLSTPEGIQTEMKKFNQRSADLREKAGKFMGVVASFQQSYQKFEEGKKEWGVALTMGTNVSNFFRGMFGAEKLEDAKTNESIAIA